MKNDVKKIMPEFILFLSNFKELLVSHDYYYSHPSNTYLLNKLEEKGEQIYSSGA